ncbi:GPO family capsid scaffolding protein [Trabulsiella odontotermitis]|uniref:Uncharacterized protein n=1 Tax=Trabulsiella odontotermitis TaxID=379893 RepID=A0A0L0H4B7_9ENTR|nr:GPO family capsid scaffolding protein [Trabulsiella odontotermitis]KNC95761.1 hypothetical protein GM31_21875 [Trabulsiella odontotermitis]
MISKPLWIPVARDGDTTDGRNIPTQDLLDMVSRFDPAVYQPKVYGSLHGYENTYVTSGWVCGLRTKNKDGVTWLHALIATNNNWFFLESEDEYPPIYTSVELIPKWSEHEQKYVQPLLVGICLCNNTVIKDLEPVNKYMVKR